MFRYCLTIFLIAFLMFLVQPLAARIMLPGFGGTASVWTASMMFFQIALLAGYLYAHLLLRLSTVKTSAIAHCILAVVAGFVINFDPLLAIDVTNKDLSWAVSKRLLLSIGGAFTVMAATNPLLSAWFAVTNNRKNAYRLYAMSNLGSMLGLFAYPIVVERYALTLQSEVWRWAYFTLAACLIACGLQVMFPKYKNDVAVQSHPSHPAIYRSQPTKILAWVFFASSASLLMISIANIMAQEVAGHPLLWVAPLAVYLFSIIICFEKPSWYLRPVFVPLLVTGSFATILLFHLGTNAGLMLQAGGFLLLLFTGSMVCHGELYRIRPPVSNLTSFYLAIAFGGAIGGIFGSAIAPRVFNGYFEFHTATMLCLFIPAIMVVAKRSNGQTQSRHAYIYCLLTIIGLAPILCSLLFFTQAELRPSLLFEARNAYGIVSVTQQDGYRKMFNGQTNHGGQFTDPAMAFQPSAYYSTGSGVDAAFQIARTFESKLNVGVIGLGTGSMLAYAKSSDQFTFYEINELSEFAARNYFTYLENGNADVIIGDGRIELQHEFDKDGSRQFDLLFLDAFSSDSIPIHLLTSEAIDIYLRHLKPTGCLVFHITNRFVDLKPVVEAAVDKHQLFSVVILHENQRFDIKTRWIIASRNAEVLASANLNTHESQEAANQNPLLWTDDCAPVGPIVKWASKIRSSK